MWMRVKHRFHRPWREISAAAVHRAVHGQHVAAAGFGHEGHAAGRHPIDRAFHRSYSALFVPAGCSGAVHFAPHQCAPPKDSRQDANSILQCSITAHRLSPQCSN
jgi:hypothetical protein